MQTDDKEKLKRQLEQAAKKLTCLDGNELAISLVTICNALLKISENTINVNDIPDELYAVYLSFTNRIKIFYDLYNKSNEKRDEKSANEIQALLEELGNLKEKQERIFSEKQQLQDEIKGLKDSMDEIPDELVVLRTKQKELEAILNELQDASIEYSTEKQMELQNKIDELTPKVEENKVAAEILQNRKDSLEKQNTQYDSERQTLTTDLIDIMTASLEQLRSVMKEHAAVLDETERTSETLAENLAKCQKKRDEFSQWFDAVETPLETMMAEIGEPENAELRKTLNINQVQTVKQTFEEIRRDLMKLDRILSGCASATQKDLQIVKRRAEH